MFTVRYVNKYSVPVGNCLNRLINSETAFKDPMLELQIAALKQFESARIKMLQSETEVAVIKDDT